MITYAFLFFVPGSAGNFFSRCLNLIDDSCYGWVAGRGPRLQLSAEQKHALFGYNSAKNAKSWTRDFENKIIRYHDIYPHHNLPAGSVSIWAQHPDYQLLEKGIKGDNDQVKVFYIDPSAMMEWTVLNAFYKDSYLDVKWLRAGRIMQDDPKIHKIPLGDIVNSDQSLLLQIERVAEILGRELPDTNRELIRDLWHQWYPTTLKPQDFEQFKQQIGWKFDPL